MLGLFQAPGLPPQGEIVENVVCVQSPGQSYALYLPTYYSASRQWPVVVAFDPAARGKLPVERFKSAAEEFGYIVVGSNGFKNGPMDLGIKSAEAIWRDVTSRFSLDPNRVYLAGFSGGARLANGIAMASSIPRAVISCGAGFRIADRSRRVPFSVIAICGAWDTNFLEMRTLHRKLQENRSRSRLIVFSGGHEWPPEPFCRQAMVTLHLQAYRDSQPADENLIQRLFFEDLGRVEQLEKADRVYDAFLGYQNIRMDYADLLDLNEIDLKIQQLGKTAEVQSAIEAEADIDALERTYLYSIQNGILENSNFKDINWWRDQLREINRIGAENDDIRFQFMRRRLIESMWRSTYERSADLAEQMSYKRAAELAEVAAIAKMDSQRLYYHSARMHGLAGNQKQAIEALAKAFENGFDDLERVQTERAFDTVRDRENFKELLSSASSTLQE
jgi:hypothetical protein